MLERLGKSHRELEASAARLASLLEAAAPNAEALRAARWDIGTRIMQHMALEDRHLFANLANDTRPAVVALARRYQVEFAQHMAGYAEHAKLWSAERVSSDWNGYRVVARKQLEFLRARIRQVETELFPLAQNASVDRALPPSTNWTKEAFAIKDSVTGVR